MSSPTNAAAIESLVSQPGSLPDGTTAAFLEESVDQAAVVAILFVASLVLVLSLLRGYARFVLIKKYGLDDWLAFSSLMPFVAFVSLCIILVHLGSGRHFVYIQYVLDNEQINLTEVLDFAAHINYTTALLICRLSGLAFYARVCKRADKMTWPIRGAAAFMVAAYIPQVLLIVFHCLPVTGLWPYAFQPEVNDYKCLQWGTVYVTNSVISLICDLILFTIPAIIITKLQISSIRKVKLSLVLMPGLLVIGISVARMYLVIVGQWTADESWSYDGLLAVEVSEIGTTLIALSIPALKPFFGNLFSFLDRSTAANSGGRPSRRLFDRSWRRANDQAVEMNERGESELSGKSASRNDSAFAPFKAFGSAQGSKEGADESQYSALALSSRGGGRNASVQSNLSQQAIIQRQGEYTVTHT